MKSKKQKALRTKNRLVLIISLSTLALILIGVVTYQWTLNKKDMDTNTSTTEMAVGKWISDNIFKTRELEDTTSEENTEAPYIPEIAVNEKITYTIPSNFLVDTDTPMDQVGFVSPDFVVGEVGVADGLDIYISVTPITEKDTLKTQREELRQLNGFSETDDITIDGVPALKYHFDGEGVHSLQYYAIKDSYSLTIIIGSKDLNAEQSYQTQINSFISSIRFK